MTIADRVATRYLTAMSESEFWKIVEDAGWGRSYKYDAIKKALMLKLKPKEADELNRMVGIMKGRLSKAVEDWERATGEHLDAYGDSWGDLLAHVVGLGKREYERNLRDPSLLKKRYHQGKYVESFDYAIPTSKDYDRLNLGKYVVWAQEALEAYEDAMLSKWYRPIRSDLSKLVDILDLMADGKFGPFLERSKEADQLARSIAKYHQNLLRKTRGREILPDVGNPWNVLNLLHDVENFLL